MKAPSFSPSVEYPAALRRLGMAAALLLAYAFYSTSGSVPVDLAMLRRAVRNVPAVAPAPEPPKGRHVIIYSAGPGAPEK